MKSPQPISASVVSAVLEDTLDGLDADVHAAFVMHEIEKLPLEEVADILGKTPLEVREFVVRAREFLIDRFEAAHCDTSEASIVELLLRARKPLSFSEEEVEAALSRIRGKALGATPPEAPPRSVSPSPSTQVEAQNHPPKFARFLPAGYVGLGVGLGIILHALLSATRLPGPSSARARVEVRTVVVHDASPAAASLPVIASLNAGHDAPQDAGVRIVRVGCTRARVVVPPEVVGAPDAGVPPPTVSEVVARPPAAEPGERGPDSIEVALIDEALSARARGDATGVLVALSRHRTRFPQSALAEQREFLAVQVLDRLNDRTATLQSAREFLLRYPASIYARSVLQIFERAQRAVAAPEQRDESRENLSPAIR